MPRSPSRGPQFQFLVLGVLSVVALVTALMLVTAFVAVAEAPAEGAHPLLRTIRTGVFVLVLRQLLFAVLEGVRNPLLPMCSAHLA